MKRRLSSLGFFTVLWIFAATACGPSVASLKQRKSEISTLKKQVRAKERIVKASEAYASALKTGDRPWFALSAKAVQKAMADFMPYRFKGEQLKKKRLKGDFAFHSPSRIVIKSGGRLTYRTKFSGKKVKVNLKGIAFATKGHARRAERALSGGGTMDVEVRVSLDKEKKYLILDGHCARVKLNKENSSDNRDMLRDALNSKFFRYPRKMPIPPALTDMKPRLITTPHHFILLGKK